VSTPRRIAATLPDDLNGPAYDGAVLAINGFLEWFFLGLLTLLVAAVSVFGLLLAAQFFRNPGRSSRPRR
jgi:hypothetical protein